MDRTTKDARNTRRLLIATQAKKLKWLPTAGSANTYHTTLEGLYVSVKKGWEDEAWWVELTFGPPDGKKDSFTDDDLNAAGFKAASSALADLFALAERQALGFEELADRLGDALGGIVDDKDDPGDDDIPF